MPVWAYSSVSQKLIWANRATLKYYSRSLEGFTSFLFSRLPPDQLSHFQVLNTLVRDEVEEGGAELLLSGFGHVVLPGVPPHEALLQSEYLFKPCVLVGADGSRQQLSQVQLVRGPQSSMGQAVIVKTVRGDQPADDAANGHKQASTVSTMLELCERILKGQEVDLHSVEAVHQAVLQGDIVPQPARTNIMDEEVLVSKEDLDQDVGLNLLQLLGGKKLGERFGAQAFDEGIEGGNGLPSLRSLAKDVGALAKAQPHEDDDSAYAAEDKEVVAASLVPAMEAVLATVDDWRFDAFKLAEVTQGHPLSALGFWLMKQYDVISQFQLDATKLARFLRRIEDGYPDNAYHNKTHAADVLQGMHCLLTRGGLHKRLGEEVAMLASYLAAVTHDYEHKGLNNDFLVRVGDELAFTYNDMSPMENHHISAAFKLMRQKEYNFIKKIPRDKWVRLRRLLIDMVLATDMKQHFNILSKFQAKLQVKLRSTSFSPNHAHLEAPSVNEPLPIGDEDADKSLVLQVGLKCADVGHLAAPWDVHHRWVSGLEEEFFRQGDKEKSMHMMVSPLMDRCKDGITKSQVGFFDIVALPLFYSWASVFHEALPLVRAVEDNCNHWRLLEMGRSQGSR